jgi:tetratricopeptide (TPR) repeat protein
MKAKLILLFSLIVCMQLLATDKKTVPNNNVSPHKAIIQPRDTVVLYDKSYVEEKVCLQVKKELTDAELILEHREKTVDWWLTVIGLMLTLFTIIFPIVVFFVGKKLYNDISADKNKLKSDINNMRRDLVRTKNQLLEEIDSYKQEAEKLIETLKLHLSKAEFIGIELDVLYNTKKAVALSEEKESSKKKDASNDDKENTNSKIQEIIKNKDASAFQRSLALAFDSYYNNQFHDAIKRYNIVLDEFMDKIDNSLLASIYFNLADSYYEIMNYEKTVEFSNLCIDLNAEDLDALHMLGLAYKKIYLKDKSKTEYLDKAIEVAHKALNINNDDDDVLTRLGEISSFNCDYKKAIEYYDKAIQIANYNSDKLNRIECLIYSNELINAHVEILSYRKTKSKDAFDIVFLETVLNTIENEKIDINQQFENLKKLAGTNFKTTSWATNVFDAWLDNDEASAFLSKKSRENLDILKALLINWKEEKNQ